MRVLVTGGAGYIGSHTALRLKEQGHEVVIFDSLELGHKPAIEGFTLVQGRTQDGALVEKVLKEHNIEAVIHFAAYKNAGESMDLPGKYFENNFGGTVSLLDAMVAAGVKKFVFSSTCAVYGTPKKLPVDESHPTGPESPYGESKYLVERALHWYDDRHSLRSVALRYFNAAGAIEDGTKGEDFTYALNLVPVVMKAALGKVPQIKVFGTDYPTRDGTCIRDYVHVLDLADAHVAALGFLDANDKSEVFNLGTGYGATVKEVVDLSREISGVDIPSENIARRAGDPIEIFADNAKAKAGLGWTPKFSIEDIIRTAWAWHSKNPDGYK